MAPQVSVAPRDPAHRERTLAVDTNILRKDSREGSAPTDEMVDTHYAALERAACPFCYEGWVYMGYEGVDENGEPVELVVRVPCRRCNADTKAL
jgi:hypothetical protein